MTCVGLFSWVLLRFSLLLMEIGADGEPTDAELRIVADLQEEMREEAIRMRKLYEERLWRNSAN